MLAAGAAKACWRVAGHVIATLHRDFLYRVRHVLDRDPDEAVGDRFAGLAPADLSGERRKSVLHRGAVERLVLSRAEDLREVIGHELADHDVGVGDGERPTAAVAFRPGIGAGRVGADTKA